MPNVKTNFASGFGIDLPRCEPAHLAGEAVSIKDFGSQSRGDRSRKLYIWLRLRSLSQNVLSRPQLSVIVMREYRPSFIFAKLTNSARPLAHIGSRSVSDLYGCNDSSDVRKKELTNPFFRTMLTHLPDAPVAAAQLNKTPTAYR
jgi:hypothetical protein